MGSRMAARLLAAGHEVTVWNRSPERTNSLLEAGGKAAATPRAAARDAEFVFSMVRDDSASRFVWLDHGAGAAAAMESSAVGVECSTLSIGWARELLEHAQARGITLVDAPVVGSRPHAEGGQLTVFIGGEVDTVERVNPLLRAFATTIHHAGPSPSGATMKLAINGLLAAQVIAVAEALALLSAQRIDLPRALEGLSATPVMSPAARNAANLMIRGEHSPLFPIELAAKDVGYLLQSAHEAGVQLPLHVRVSEIYQDAIGAGLSSRNLTAIIEQYSSARERQR